MEEELRTKAEKKVKYKKAFFILTIVFAFTSLILIMLSFYLSPVAFWLRLPIPAFVMVLSIVYLYAFGLPTSGVPLEDWEEEEIQKEMARLYWQKKTQLPPQEELSETEVLELKELDRLKRKWEWREDIV